MTTRLPNPVPPDLLRRALDILAAPDSLVDRRESTTDELDRLRRQLGTEPSLTVDLFQRAVGLINHLELDPDECDDLTDEAIAVAAEAPMKMPEPDAEPLALDPDDPEAAFDPSNYVIPEFDSEDFDARLDPPADKN